MGEKRESHGQRNMFVFIGVERMNDEFQQADRIMSEGRGKIHHVLFFQDSKDIRTKIYGRRQAHRGAPTRWTGQGRRYPRSGR